MTFSINTAHMLAAASQAVYLDEAEAKNWAVDRGFKEFAWFDTDDTQAAIMVDDDRCVLAFRGTSSVTDWMTDMDVFKEPDVYGRVHQGFQGALDAVWNDVENAIQDSRDLYITGHSLGAALATLSAARFGAIVDGLYTFGSPRVGDPEFVTQFNRIHNSYRFVNNNDIVTRIPMVGYEHVSSLRHFTQSGKMWVEPSWRWVEWDRIWGRMRRKIADGVKDHSIGDYVSLVAGQL